MFNDACDRTSDMFLKAIIDETTELSAQEARFASILDFVADSCDNGIFCLFKDWSIRRAMGEPTMEFEPTRPRLVYFSKHEVAANGGRWKAEDGSLSIPLHVPTSELVYSTSRAICQGALEQQGLNATTALLTLAAAGVDIVLPNVSFSRKSADEMKEIRIKLEEERVNYIAAISEIADQAFGRLSSGDFKDIHAWARTEATLRILPKARYLQLQLKKLDHSLLERASVQFWKDGVPAIGKALVKLGEGRSDSGNCGGINSCSSRNTCETN
ncbi:MAG TPA: hypothetical protein VLB46_19645 [Pyrinomonadaceae bacterium]|nr:hypothetical protein [Pyrinomonadaceae bacterium]